MKYLVTRKLPIEDIYRWSFVGSIVLSLICTGLAVADALWSAVVIAILTTLGVIIETIIVSRQFWTNGLKINT
jgi:uncharacterized membrane protein